MTPAVATAGTVGTDPRGRWERFEGNPSIVEQTTLDLRATWLLGQTSTLRPDLAVTLAPERWGGFADIDLGDTVSVAITSGRLALTGSHRVVEIIAVPGEDGTEQIMLGLVAT